MSFIVACACIARNEPSIAVYDVCANDDIADDMYNINSVMPTRSRLDMQQAKVTAVAL